MPIQTFQDPITKRITDASGNYISDLADYKDKVIRGIYSSAVVKPVPPAGSVPIPGAQYAGMSPEQARAAQQAAYSNIQPIGNTLYGTPIQRDGADFKVTMTGDLGQWKNGTMLVEAARKIILEKQKANNDIVTAKQLWRDRATDVRTFEGKGQKQFTELSPAEQADVRSSAWMTAQNHIKGLNEEAAYRQTKTEDVLTQIRGIYDDQIKAIEAAKKDTNDKEKLELDKRSLDIQEERNRILNQKDLYDMGSNYIYDDKGNLVYDFSSATAQDIANAMKAVESGGDYNVKGTSGENGAYQFMPDTWAAWSSAYANEVLKKSTKGLSMTPENQDAVAIWKVQKLLDAGYSAQDIAAIWNSGAVRKNEKGQYTNSKGELNVQEHVDKVLKALKNILPQTSTGGHIKLTPAEQKNVIEKTGLSEAETKKLTVSAANNLLEAFRQTDMEQAAQLITIGDPENGIKPLKEEIIIRGTVITQPSPEQILSYLKEMYQNKLETEDLKQVLYGVGYKEGGIFNSSWSDAGNTTSIK